VPSTHSRGDYGDTPEAIRADVTRLAEAGNAAGLRALVDQLPARQELHYERHRARALALALAGALEAAEAELAVAFAGHGPTTAAVAADLAQVRLLAGHPDEALAALTPALRAGGGADPSVQRVAGEIARARRGGWRKAAAAGLAARPLWHAAPVAAAAVGGALRGRGQPVPFGRLALVAVCLAGAVSTIALLPRGTIDGIDRLRPHVQHGAEAPAVVRAPNATPGHAAGRSGRPTSPGTAPGVSLSALGVPTGLASIRGGPSQPLPAPKPPPSAPEAPGTPPQPEPTPPPAPSPSPSPTPTPTPTPTPAPQPAPSTPAPSGAASTPPPTSRPTTASSGSSGKGKGHGNDKPKDRPKPKEKDKDKPNRPSVPAPASTQPAPSTQTAQPEQEQESGDSDDHGKDKGKEKGDDGDKGHGDDGNGKGKDKGK
jgi:hypothetical protein